MTSSLFALGYHEQLETKARAPQFLKDLRQAAFARAYSADKNVAIFLGRPPRILRKYSRVLPRHVQWRPDETYSLMADTKWSALCAILKEDILDLSREENYDERTRKARSVMLIHCCRNVLINKVLYKPTLKYNGRHYLHTSAWRDL